MFRYTETEFTDKNSKLNQDDIYAIQIKNHKVHLLGYMEDALNYKIKQVNHPEKFILSDKDIKDNELMQDIIEHNTEYNNVTIIEPASDNEYKDFIDIVKPDVILCVSIYELQSIHDLLCDGNYIFIIPSIRIQKFDHPYYDKGYNDGYEDGVNDNQ